VFRIFAASSAQPTTVREASFDELPSLLAQPDARVWVDLTPPIGDVETAIVRDVFKFHPLAIRDCREHPDRDTADEAITEAATPSMKWRSDK